MDIIDNDDAEVVVVKILESGSEFLASTVLVQDLQTPVQVHVVKTRY